MEKKSTFQSGGGGEFTRFYWFCVLQNLGNDLPHQKLMKKTSFQPVQEGVCLKHTEKKILFFFFFFFAVRPHVTWDKRGKFYAKSP